MQYYYVVIFMLAMAILMSAVAPRIRLPYPVVLMIAGILLGFMPWFEYVPIEPKMVFFIFLPPLLYDSAVNISFTEFRKNAPTIAMMAFLLVLVTMTVIAVVVKYLIPEVSWPVAFIIGAILSPPDAVAVSGILRDMRLPHRTRTILEGESLVNDASALTAYRIILGVITGNVFNVWEAGLEFLVIIIGGAAVGLIMAFLFGLVVRSVPWNSTVVVSLNILMPFVAYSLAETVEVSGVIAVFVMGIMISRQISRNKLFSQMTCDQSRSVWKVIIYMLSGLVFILIGIEFPESARSIPKTYLWPHILTAVVIAATALVIRILVVFHHKYTLDTIGRRRTKKTHAEGHVKPLHWKDAMIISWSGIRGIVSVATAIALPVVVHGENFTARSSIVFLTVVVVVIMLLVQGMGLPLLIKLLKFSPEDNPVAQIDNTKNRM